LDLPGLYKDKRFDKTTFMDSRFNRMSPWWQSTPPGVITCLGNGDIVISDARKFLKRLNSESADIVFLDPPFNLGKSYGAKDPKADLLNEEKYLKFLRKILKQSARVLKPGGSLYLYHIPRWAVACASILQKRLQFRHWISISMKNGFVRPNHLYPAHYALLYFTKGAPAVFRRPKIAPSRCRHCKKLIKDYGGYEKFVRDGVNLSDVWEDLSPVRHKKYKHRKANELHPEISRRVLEMSGVPLGLFVDPFAGAGSSLIAAAETGMFFAACDREKENCTLIYKRMRDLTGRPKIFREDTRS